MSSKCLYLGGLPESLREHDVYTHLSVYGKISALHLHTGYAFVEFEAESDASDVVATFLHQPFLGHDIKFQFARHDAPRPPGKSGSHSSSPSSERSRSKALTPDHRKTLYPVMVLNLSTRTSWQDLKDFARVAGSVAFCKIERGKGFVEYVKQEDADRAVEELDGKELHGSALTIYLHGPQRRQSNSRQYSPSPAAHSSARRHHPYARLRETERGHGHHGHVDTGYTPRQWRAKGEAPSPDKPRYDCEHTPIRPVRGITRGGEDCEEDSNGRDHHKIGDKNGYPRGQWTKCT
ncbi:hypothetical protein K474DRAFT_540079 [Panus rudis PR-1116 ss-1]|nr:hypothetical protein K474DRAFT_540079 [Panus rudis PR-1116 ss-1]